MTWEEIKNRIHAARARPKKRAVAFLTNDSWADLASLGYTSLVNNPEIVAAVDTIARLISSMTIHLMENTDHGDVRVRDGLARKIDIEPNRYLDRAGFVYWIVRTMLLEGDGNAVVLPITKDGLIEDLEPIPPGMVSLVPDGRRGYFVDISGKRYDPENVLHFVANPSSSEPWRGAGYRVALSDVAHNLQQAAETTKGFMESKWKPSIIVKADGLVDEFASPEGREKLIDSYLSGKPGAPWIIPADQFAVEQIRPLSLADLAISDVVTLDKRTVASIIGVPAFVLGVGTFNRDEWNNFISSKIMPLAKVIEQQLTRKLLISPSRYFRFSSRSLYAYDLKDLAAIADDQYIRGLMHGNEVRDWLGLSPLDGLDELVILENYIPAGMIGDQKKLIQKQEGGEGDGKKNP